MGRRISTVFCQLCEKDFLSRPGGNNHGQIEFSLNPRGQLPIAAWVPFLSRPPSSGINYGEISNFLGFQEILDRHIVFASHFKIDLGGDCWRPDRLSEQLIQRYDVRRGARRIWSALVEPVRRSLSDQFLWKSYTHPGAAESAYQGCLQQTLEIDAEVILTGSEPTNELPRRLP